MGGMKMGMLTYDNIIRGLNLWMDAYIADPKSFEAEFETVKRHEAERSDGVEPTYGEVGLRMMVEMLTEKAA